MGRYSREEVKRHITENLDEVVDQIQYMLTEPFICMDECKDCEYDKLCVNEGIIAEVLDGSNETVPDGEDKGTGKPDKHT